MLKKHHRLLCFCRKQSVVGFGAQSPPGLGRLGVGTAGSGREMPLVPSRRWPWTVCACFPGQVGEFRGCHASLEGVAVPAVPLGLSSFLGKNRAGPRPPPPLPRAQPASDVCGATPAGGGPLVGVPPPGAEGSRLPPEGAWWLLVADRPDGHGAGWEQLSPSPRRGWWARTGRGPAPSAGKPGPAAEPSPGTPLGSWQVGWGGPRWARGCPGGMGVRGWVVPTPCPCASSTWSPASW